jgi:hypothetical protein
LGRVSDRNGQDSRQALANLLTRDHARRIAAKLPELLSRPQC